MSEITATKNAASACSTRVNRVPISTYRLQLGSDLTLDRVRKLLPYLQSLGISDLYLSPLFRSRAESSHGYDVVDHGTIDPEIGDLAAFQHLAEAASASDMGILLDVVPNHMGINDPANVWWLDVLENGQGSYFADFFDIEWHPPAAGLQDKILLPFLAEPFGRVLENGELRVVYVNGRLQVAYGPRRFPLTPISWAVVLELALAHSEDVGDPDKRSNSDWSELQSIITQLGHLPPGVRRDQPSMEERYREQRIARLRIEQLMRTSANVRAGFELALRQVNGEKNNPKSFDLLESLLEQQWYRLAYWRVASDEINYRRFFDINDLAAIRVEDPRVFDAVHRLVRKFFEMGWITGLRIDHPDGLREPHSYFKSLQALYRSHRKSDGSDASEVYIVAEKILSGDEPLPEDWAICGTTGYELLNIINRLQVNAEGFAELRTFYDRGIGNTRKPADIVYESRREVLLGSMASELQMLASALYRIAQKHRASRDFTQPVLRRSLREVLANMTVYRTYARGDSWDISDADYRTVTTAVRMAKRRNRTLLASVFDFIASVLLLEHPPTIDEEQAIERRQFALKFQQVSGPVAAKGVEDTAFYRYYPLASLNEVGGELDARPIAIDEFHRLMRHRMDSWPHSLCATSTHDSKRGEDMRARLNVLSEMPEEWGQAFMRWQSMNRPLIREVDGESVPDANEEYFIYQTLVGTWPTESLSVPEREAYCDRITRYMEKAFREAKLRTSWMNPTDAYESAVRDFIRDLFGTAGEHFTADMSRFVRQIADCGYVNSLAQLLLKMTIPGVPDFYRGTELWDFNLVDPDNRRPVDYDVRRRRLHKLQEAGSKSHVEAAREVSRKWPDSDVKLWITSKCLKLRHDHADVFSFGEYIPLAAEGKFAEHLICFSRRLQNEYMIAIVPRNFYRLVKHSGRGDSQAGPPAAKWNGTSIVMPSDFPRSWKCELSGLCLETRNANDRSMDVAKLLEVFPIALLNSCEH
ncbi:MAG TPA: malto-oligosyltrehalose synthase [Lacipirellulaceae bacterium]|nr:malto-oligosyltrehalose synthase [Lacipirellulaceae bacterium]